VDQGDERARERARDLTCQVVATGTRGIDNDGH
jgi:hypothetical protein